MPKRKKRPTNIQTSQLMPEELAEQLRALAARALHHIEESNVFVGVSDERGYGGAGAIEFTLQIGYCVLNDKPIILPVPYGVEIPKKLAAIADKIIRFDPKDLSTMELGLKQYFTEAGVVPQ